MNKIKTKEELKQELEQWKTMLSREVYSYLEALIKLDNYILNNNPTAPIRMGKMFEIDSFKNLPVPNTALMLFNRILSKNTITPTIRENLLNLDIYRDISTYNIYWHLQSIFSSYQHNNIILEDNRNQIDGIKLNIQIDNNIIPIFSYFYYSMNNNRHNQEKTESIGKILLLKTEELSKEERENNIQTKEEFLNILLSNNNGKENNLIRAKKEEIDFLKSKIELTDTDKELIKIKNDYYQYILESLKLSDSTYEEKTSYQQTTKLLLKSYPEVKVRASIDKI